MIFADEDYVREKAAGTTDPKYLVQKYSKWTRQEWVIHTLIIAALKGLVDVSVENFFSINIPHATASVGVTEDYQQLYNILVGETGGMGSDTLLWKTEQGRVVWNTVCDLFGWEDAKTE